MDNSERARTRTRLRSKKKGKESGEKKFFGCISFFASPAIARYTSVKKRKKERNRVHVSIWRARNNDVSLDARRSWRRSTGAVGAISVGSQFSRRAPALERDGRGGDTLYNFSARALRTASNCE